MSNSTQPSLFDMLSPGNESDEINKLDDREILERIRAYIDPDFLSTSDFLFLENKGSYNSYLIEAKKTSYRIGFDAQALFARIKTTGKVHYIAFSSVHKKRIDGVFNYAEEKSGFLRIDIPEFLDKISSSADAQKALNSIYINSFSFAKFGCCGRYKECSREKKCIHPDPIYSNACEYRHHLENGEIFY